MRTEWEMSKSVCVGSVPIAKPAMLAYGKKATRYPLLFVFPTKPEQTEALVMGIGTLETEVYVLQDVFFRVAGDQAAYRASEKRED